VLVLQEGVKEEGVGFCVSVCVCAYLLIGQFVHMYIETENVCFRKRNFDDEVKRIK